MPRFLTAVFSKVRQRQLAFRIEDEFNNSVGWAMSNGSPEGVMGGNRGSLCSDISTGALYRKTTTSGNTGWVADSTANMPASTIKGAIVAGPPVDLTPAQARLILRRDKNVLAFNATQNWDIAQALYHRLTATSNFTLNFPTNVVEGETAFMYVTQDNIGGRQITFGPGFQAPGGISTMQLSAAANAVDRLEFFFDSATTCTVTMAKGIS